MNEREMRQHGMPRKHALLLSSIEAAKGLEFDHVVLVEPAAVAEAEPDRRTGLRRLYVVLTRAVSGLTVLHAAPLPAELAPRCVAADAAGGDPLPGRGRCPG